MKPLTVQALERIGKDWSVGNKTREGHLQHTKDFADFVSERFAMDVTTSNVLTHPTPFS